MNRRVLRLTALVLISISIAVIMPLGFFENNVKAASKPTYSQKTRYYYDESFKGYVIVPDEEGTYDPVILIHGLYGIGEYPDNVIKAANTWVELGYMEPVAFILPEIVKADFPSEHEAFRYFANDPRDIKKSGFLKVYKKIKDGSLNSKIDKDAQISVGGYSFGGACAIYCGLSHSDKILNVGGFSPARTMLMFKWSWDDDPTTFVFTDEPDAHLMISYGTKESADFKETAEYYANTAAAQGNVNSFVAYECPIGSHTQPMFIRETFAFMYYINNDSVPNAAIVEQACSYVNSKLGKVSVSGETKTGSTLTANVSEGSVSSPSYSYQWMRGDKVISGATSKTYKLTDSDKGCTITCLVAETNGKVEGYISGSVKYEAPTTTVTDKPTETVTETPTEKPSDPTKAPTTDAPTTMPVEPNTTVTPTSGEKINDSEDLISAFVERNYQTILGRGSDKEGADYWFNELYNFRLTGAETARFFIFSKEFTDKNTTNEEFVTVLYKLFFDRDPDSEGYTYWTYLLNEKINDRETVVEGFINSQEWADTCASYGIRSGSNIKPQVKIASSDSICSFVERMYTTALNRESDPEGMAYWADLVANYNCTGEEIGLRFFMSPEMEGYGLDNAEFVTRLYKTFMDRDPDDEGLDFWVSCLKDGMSRESVVLGFTRSEEFVDKCIKSRILPY